MTKGANNAFTPAQVRAIRAAPPAEKEKLRKLYRSQAAAKKVGPPRVQRTITKVTQQQPRRRPMVKASVPMSARVTNIYNPMNPHPVPTVTSEGKAFPMTALVSDDFTVGTNPTLLICANNGVSATVGFLIELNTDYSWPSEATEKMLTLPRIYNTI